MFNLFLKTKTFFLINVNNTTSLMAYQNLMMRNPQYFAAAAAAFSSSATPCSSATVLPPGVGNCFGFKMNLFYFYLFIRIFFTTKLSKSYIPFPIVTTNIGDSPFTTLSSINSSVLQLQQQTISNSPVIITSSKSPPQQICGEAGVTTQSEDGFIVANSTVTSDEQQHSAQWSSPSETLNFQQNRIQKSDIKITKTAKTENSDEASPQRTISHSSTPYSPERQQINIHNNDNSETNQQINQNVVKYNNGGSE
ncbi:hypothetical protein Mgra_00008004 [Meloidogyne graminicola]|uniref:Uncharacterized protein n=1 Tax=Meloidogyne graminicola TaxID=189291 RepID=A0A8S9ZGX2_9BILA|nr:hypothetical protein Mgra_00008004 [Meloidogyne graminicola]